ncbi:unnamed protein product [Phytomonas sp. EM1]|nr:unnamed protein product [Phytomonas sp. EM1]|eukprot:CCW65783.1 unnamed protein product [Phytomonas sp. isolate EM1]
MVSVAQTLRCLLEAEGSTFHSALHAVPLPAMGGGMGIVASEDVELGTTLATLAFTSMLTTTKARYNLALTEVALRSFAEERMGGGLPKGQVLRFAAELPNSEEMEEHSGCRSEFHFQDAVRATIANLKQQLSPTETMTSHIVLMASLYRNAKTTAKKFKEEASRIGGKSHTDGAHRGTLGEGSANSTSTVMFRYTSENAWMQGWMNALPTAYNNLLEVSKGVYMGVDLMESYLQAVDAPPVGDSELRKTLWFDRQRSKVACEQADVARRYQHCLDVLLCLRELPVGVNEEGARLSTEIFDHNREGESVAQAQKGTSCTFDQFLWAFNTLMSRGFAFHDEVWVMMPLVDYFNYALHANCTMFPQRCSVLKKRRSRNNNRERGAAIRSDAEIDSKPTPSTNYIRKGGLAALSPRNGWEYVFQAISPIDAGEQVCISYGAYSDFECLLWYGFTQRPYLLPTTALPSVPARDLESILFFPNSKSARVFLQKVGIDAKGLSDLHAALPRLQDESFRQVTFERFWKERMAAFSDKKSGRKPEYDKWQSALQKAFAFVFSSLQDADGVYSDKCEGITWIDELVICYLKTPDHLAFEGSHSGASMFQEESVLLDRWCRRLALHWQSFLSATVSNGLKTSCSAQKCTLGVFGASFQMHEWIHGIARGYWNLLRNEISSSDALGETGTLSLSSLQDAKLFVLRAIAWMELYSNYCWHDCYFRLNDIAANTKEGSVGVIMHRPSANDVWNFSARSMGLTASLDSWLLLQYLALEASDVELLAYLDFECE